MAYQGVFVEGYEPNQYQLLPSSLLTDLGAAARMSGQQPAGTYARNVMAPLLIDLSWSSSPLEGNRYSLLETKALFESASRCHPLSVASHDVHAVPVIPMRMVLNPKSSKSEIAPGASPGEGSTRQYARPYRRIGLSKRVFHEH
ncbi:hypothetical protein [Stenotrophomonas rhizophila]|uniref:hypothetical protein n=1 Tax=Stenotrophomonas rhizophila TaxID=216778 RepID=UPI0015E83933|nr:hypothetical protein [Stenotrophomonas rhizophila]